jgi:AcrR family transcriptional regulator
VRAPKQERSQITRDRLLSAAIDILIEDGYSKLAAARVSDRAGVTRGAQQHHFSTKASLVVSAVNQLAERQVRDIIRDSTQMGDGRQRVNRALDRLWKSYSGDLFAAWLDVTVAARTDPELRPHVDALDRTLDHAIREMLAESFGSDIASGPDFHQHVEMALATIRGFALLLTVGHDARSVERQWAFAREQLTRQLAPEE